MALVASSALAPSVGAPALAKKLSSGLETLASDTDGTGALGATLALGVIIGVTGVLPCARMSAYTSCIAAANASRSTVDAPREALATHNCTESIGSAALDKNFTAPSTLTAPFPSTSSVRKCPKYFLRSASVMGAAFTVVALALAGVLGDSTIPPPTLFPSPPAPGVTNAAFGASISRATSSKHSPSSFADASRPVPRVAAFQILLNAPSLNPLGRKNATACSPRIVPCPLALARVQCALSASASRIVARKLSGVQRSDDIRAATNASRVASRARVRVARGARRAREGVFFRSRDPRSNSDARSIVTTDARRSVDCRAMQREPRRATAATTTVDRRTRRRRRRARWDRSAARGRNRGMRYKVDDDGMG